MDQLSSYIIQKYLSSHWILVMDKFALEILQVSFWNQESLVDTIQQAVEAKLLESNNTRMFTTQVLHAPYLLGGDGKCSRSLEQHANIADRIIMRIAVDCFRSSGCGFIEYDEYWNLFVELL